MFKKMTSNKSRAVFWCYWRLTGKHASSLLFSTCNGCFRWPVPPSQSTHRWPGPLAELKVCVRVLIDISLIQAGTWPMKRCKLGEGIILQPPATFRWVSWWGVGKTHLVKGNINRIKRGRTESCGSPPLDVGDAAVIYSFCHWNLFHDVNASRLSTLRATCLVPSLPFWPKMACESRVVVYIKNVAT